MRQVEQVSQPIGPVYDASLEISSDPAPVPTQNSECRKSFRISWHSEFCIGTGECKEHANSVDDKVGKGSNSVCR